MVPLLYLFPAYWRCWTLPVLGLEPLPALSNGFVLLTGEFASVTASGCDIITLRSCLMLEQASLSSV